MVRAGPKLRTLVSYIPNRSLLRARNLADRMLGLRRRPHEDDYLAFRSFEINRPRVVDVGANRGQAISSLRIVLDDPTICSFEPNIELASHLCERFGSEQWCEVLPYALGSQTGTLTLFLPKYGHTVWDTRASLREEEARRHLNPETFWAFSPDRASVVRMEVAMRMLDEFDLQPDILKVDVEGAEGEVIRGGMATIESSMPAILVEGDPKEPEALLARLGYVRHRYDPVRNIFYKGQAGSLNTFILHPSHESLFGQVTIVEE